MAIRGLFEFRGLRFFTRKAQPCGTEAVLRPGKNNEDIGQAVQYILRNKNITGSISSWRWPSGDYHVLRREVSGTASSREWSSSTDRAQTVSGLVRCIELYL